MIQSVTGPLAPEKCNMVLSHEHLFIDLTNQAAPGALERPLETADHSRMMCDPYSIKDDLLLDNFDDALTECCALAAAGCDLVVDCTTYEIGRDPQKLRQLSEQSRVNIVMGCGFYTADTHRQDFLSDTAESAAAKLIEEITCGIDGIKPGIIGEIGTGKVIQPGEYKALQAAAIAARSTGLAVQVHIYPWSDNGIEAADLLIKSGVAPERIVICHSDVALDMEYIDALLRRNVYVEFDNFAKEFTPGAGGFAEGSFAADSQRCAAAAGIIRRNRGKQLLLCNDICLKCMLKKFGGNGYTHIFDHIVDMLGTYNVEADYVKQVILRENPLRMLTV